MRILRQEGLPDLKDCACDIIVQAGQSNAQGAGLGGEDYKPLDGVIFARVGFTFAHDEKYLRVCYSGDVYVSDTCEGFNNVRLGNFASTFVGNYKKNDLEKGRVLFVLQTAVGGTSLINHWGAQRPLYAKTLEITDWALSLNPANRVKALLWHQGEQDVVMTDWDYDKRVATHTEGLNAVIASFRGKYGDVPFVCANFTKRWRDKHAESSGAIADAMRNVCASAGKAAFVETDDLPDNDMATGNGDELHFSRAALEEMGNRYYEKYAEIVRNGR